MIRIEVDEFTVDVPVEKHMPADKFLEISDRLRQLFGRGGANGTVFSHSQPIISQKSTAPVIPETPIEEPFLPTQHEHASTHLHASESNAEDHFEQSVHEHAHEHHHSLEEFRFEHEEKQRLDYFMTHIAHQLQNIQATQSRLEMLERNMMERINRR